MTYDESKFTQFSELLRQAKGDGRGGVEVLIVASPEVLGDTYEELVENLNRIADAKLAIQIVPRSKR